MTTTGGVECTRSVSEERPRTLKIVLLGDSLSLPRGPAQGDIPYEATYPVLLERSLRARLGAQVPWLIERGLRLRTILRVPSDWYEQIELKKPDILVVHVGVVDCAPRVFLPLERHMVNAIRPKRLRAWVLGLVNKHRRAIIRLRPNRVYVSHRRFERGVQQVVEKAYLSGLRGLIFVNIVAPPDDLEYRSPGFRRNVELYNRTLAEQAGRFPWVRLVDFNGLVWQGGDPTSLLLDGVHPNRKGHALLAEELERHILELGGMS